jgi:hypothetical protein
MRLPDALPAQFFAPDGQITDRGSFGEQACLIASRRGVALAAAP